MAPRRIVSDEALDALFRAPRGGRGWLGRVVSDTMLRALWELVKLGPACGPGGPAGVVFVKSPEAKSRLAAALPAPERERVATAPVAAIVACPPENDAAAAARESALCAAYLIVAARALGLDCGPIRQFDSKLVDASFFPDRRLAAGFLCALGYGDDARPSTPETHPARGEACAIL